MVNIKNVVTKFINFSPQYLEDIVELGNERLGDGYADKDSLQAYAQNKNNIFKLIIDAENDKLVGFFKMHGTDISGLAEEFKLTAEEIRKFVGDREKICIAKSLVLQKVYEKAGLATELVRTSLKEAKQMGFYSCWSPLWIRKDGIIPAGRLMDRNGFTFYKNVHMLWYNDKDYKCIDCAGPCKCDAAIYYKIL